LRFVAGFQVLVFHCAEWQSWRGPELVRNVAGSGYVAVSLFFVLSGFILTYVHGTSGDRPLERGEFYLARFARIYPVYALGLVLAAPFFIGHALRTQGGASLPLQCGAVLTLVQAHVPSLAMSWNPPAWSLSAEAFFYLLFPVLAPPIVRCRPGLAWGIGAASYAACLAVPLAYLALTHGAGAPATYESAGFWLDAIRYSPVVRLPEFVMGIALGRSWLDPRTRGWIEERASVLSLAAAGVLLVTLGAGSRIPYVLLHNGLLAPVFAALIAALAAGRGPLARVLSTASAVALGEASYSLYILHVPLLMIAHKALAANDALFESPAFRAVFMVVAVGASLVCHRYFEVPMRRVARDAWNRSLGAGSATAGT
jgi:peptidoglycan/LPS O-acetylase OafA/YrhL